MKIYKTLAEAQVDGFYNITGIARELNITRQCVHHWTKRDPEGFPGVTAMYRRDSLRMAPLMNLKDIKDWHNLSTGPQFAVST